MCDALRVQVSHRKHHLSEVEPSDGLREAALLWDALEQLAALHQLQYDVHCLWGVKHFLHRNYARLKRKYVYSF